jgi:hypothetical protein
MKKNKTPKALHSFHFIISFFSKPSPPLLNSQTDPKRILNNSIFFTRTPYLLDEVGS